MLNVGGNCARETAAGAMPACTVERTSWGGYDVRIRGKMPHGWIGSLSSGMAKSGVDILRGRARKLEASSWEASFEVRPAAHGVEPGKIDYLRLLRHDRRASGAGLSLDEVSLRTERTSGALYVEVKAKDQTGFLAEILNRFSFFSLFPEQMVIETREDSVYDRFWLKSPGGMTPSEEIVGVLRRRLETMTAR